MRIQPSLLLACYVAIVSTARVVHAQYIPLDLQPQANQLLDEDFAPGDYRGDRLSDLKQGGQVLNGVSFRVGKGLIQVAGEFLPDHPRRVTGITVGRHAKRIHLLHAARWGAYGEEGDSLGHWVADGTPIGYYEVKYADAETEAIPIVYGIDVRDWWSVWDDSKPTKRSRVAWTGNNPHLRSRSEAQHTVTPLRLFLTTWVNPNPESRITNINLVSLKQKAAPFCVAITVEAIPARNSAKFRELEAKIDRLSSDFHTLKTRVEQGPGGGRSSRSFRDEFAGKLDKAWSIVNHNPENLSLTKRDGMLTITTEQGGIWKAYEGTKNLALIDNPISSDADFVMTTRLVGFDPEANYNQAGLICFDDIDNYLKFVLQWDSNQGGRALCSLREERGEIVRTRHVKVGGRLDEVWLRVVKQGKHFVVAASHNGQHYSVLGEESWENWQPARVGLIAKNGAPGNAPRLDASFDYFEIVPLAEDQNPFLSEGDEDGGSSP